MDCDDTRSQLPSDRPSHTGRFHRQSPAKASIVKPGDVGAGHNQPGTPLAEAIHARALEPSDGQAYRRGRNRGSTPAYSDNGGTACVGSRLINSFNSLPGLK